MTFATRVAAAAIAIAVVGFAALNLVRPGSGPGGRSTASAPAAASPTPTVHPSSTATATLSPVSLTGQIAFQRSVDSNVDLYTMNLDRTALVRLTSDPGDDQDPSWSPDGERIVFTRGEGEARDVYVINADGTGETRLTTSPEGEDRPAFSADGSKIRFLRYVDPDFFDIYEMDADGANARRLWHQDGAWAAGPAWSPQDRFVYFNLDTSGGGTIDIGRLDTTTGALTRLSPSPGDDSTFAISRDGSTIVFQSDRPPAGLFLMDIDGSNVRHLFGDWSKGRGVSWAPDGRHIAFEDEDGWLSLLDLDGTDPIRWTQGLAPAWRPTP